MFSFKPAIDQHQGREESEVADKQPCDFKGQSDRHQHADQQREEGEKGDGVTLSIVGVGVTIGGNVLVSQAVPLGEGG